MVPRKIFRLRDAKKALNLRKRILSGDKNANLDLDNLAQNVGFHDGKALLAYIDQTWANLEDLLKEIGEIHKLFKQELKQIDQSKLKEWFDINDAFDTFKGTALYESRIIELILENPKLFKLAAYENDDLKSIIDKQLVEPFWRNQLTPSEKSIEMKLINDSGHYAYSKEKRKEIVAEFKSASDAGQVTDRNFWALSKYGISGRTLRNYIKEMEA